MAKMIFFILRHPAAGIVDFVLLYLILVETIGSDSQEYSDRQKSDEFDGVFFDDIVIAHSDISLMKAKSISENW